MKIISVLFITLFTTAAVHAAAPPFYPEPVRSPPADEPMKMEVGRLRISVASTELEPARRVRLGNVFACSDSACFRAETPAYVDLGNTSNGESTFVVDMEVPRKDIQKVIFEEVAGPVSVAGEIDLTSFMLASQPPVGEEIFILLKRSVQGQTETFKPFSFGRNYVGHTQASVYYDPSRQTSVKLRLGTEMTIPAGALPGPAVFRVQVDDTGRVFPRVDIFPEVKLLKPATIEVTQIVREYEKPGYQGPEPILRPTLKTSKILLYSQTGKAAKYRRTFDQTGTLIFEPKDDSDVSKGALGSTNGAVDCSMFLETSIAAKKGSQPLLPEGFQQISICTDIPPYVHIATGSMRNPTKSLFSRYSTSTSKNNMLQFNLLPITDFSTASSIAINGFVWEGDSGRGAGLGMPSGHLASNGQMLADNRVGGGYSKDVSGNSAGNKLVFRWNRKGDYIWEENADAKALDLSEYDNHISSSTSVVKKGSCTSDGLMSRWSAIGTTDNGKLVFVSSAAEKETSAAELCRIFRALKVTNAIRLDGGPSASIVVDGVFLNPLSGVYRVAYGDARNIAYALIMR